MSLRFNPFTGTFDLVGKREVSSSSSIGFYTQFNCGKIVDVEEGFDNEIDCCSLPVTIERKIIDLGTLDELCN